MTASFAQDRMKNEEEEGEKLFRRSLQSKTAMRAHAHTHTHRAGAAKIGWWCDLDKMCSYTYLVVS